MSCEQYSSFLPSPLPLALATLGYDPTISDISIEAGLTIYLTNHPKISCAVGNRVYPYYVDDTSPFPAISFEITDEPVEACTLQSGKAIAEIAITCWSDNFNDTVTVANEIRRALQGFRGWFGNVAIDASKYIDSDDEKQSPADSSAVYWFGRTLTFRVTYYVDTHTF